MTAAEQSIEVASKLPPMLEQYLEYKAKQPDALLFFQVGDFYETFFEDAQTVSRVLNLTLTSRDKNSPNPIPMAGVPLAVIDAYAARLVDAGYSVALVSQAEVARPGKMVTRKLDRIITPGIRLLGNADSGSSIVAAIHAESELEAAISFSEVQSGKVFVREGFGVIGLAQEVSRLGPTEVIIPAMLAGKRIDRRTSWVREIENVVGPSGVRFRADQPISPQSGSGRTFAEIRGYSVLSSAGRRSLRLLVDYIDEVTVSSAIGIREVSLKTYDNTLSIDARTRNNLELTKNLRDGSPRGTLLDYLDHTVSSAGARLLRVWVLSPLTNRAQIVARQQAVQTLRAKGESRRAIQQALEAICDMERVGARIELGVCFPSELGALRDALGRLPIVQQHLREVAANNSALSSGLLTDLASRLDFNSDLKQRLDLALVDSPAPALNEGGIIREGYDAELDRYRKLRTEGKSWLAELETRERAKTGINSLKIRFNSVLGYFFEVTKANAEKVPNTFIRRQSTAQSDRFVTEELVKLADDVVGAEAKQFERERELYLALRNSVVPLVNQLRELALVVAEIDVLAGLAELADREDLICPEMTEATTLIIKNGKHPVLASLLQGKIIPNSLEMGEDSRRCLVLTGPNMGGKSTYLRQAALIVIMAQLGSFVPAEEAQIGIVDKLFARLGASDDQTEGESTFMVEMKEAAGIIANSTRKSLLLIDEIGRGTATRDGLAIAQAILEWIVTTGLCRTLFATHFHELTELPAKYPMMHNLSVGSVDHGDQVIFTHEIKDGAADKSYGIEVAKLAGLPEDLTARARVLLEAREAEARPATQQMALFVPSTKPQRKEASAAIPAIALQELRELEQLRELKAKILDAEINSLTPLASLTLLSELQNRVKQGK